MDLGSARPASYPEKDDAKTKQTIIFLMSTVHYDLLHSKLKFSFRLQDLTFYCFHFIYYHSKNTQPGENAVIKAMGLKFRLQILLTENRLKCKHLKRNTKYFNIAGPHIVYSRSILFLDI